MSSKFFHTFLIFSLFLQITFSAKILSLAFIGSRSHKITYESLLEKLAERGHKITIVSQTLTPHFKDKPNIRDILTINFDDWDKDSPIDMFAMRERGEELNPFKMLDIFGSVCEKTYDLPIIKEILSQKWDMVMVESYFNECVAGLIYKLNTTLIIVSPVAAPSYVSTMLGSPTPPSFVPALFGDFSDRMTFWERVLNFIAEVSLILVRDLSYKPAMDEIYRRKLNDSNLPGSEEVFRNASIVLSCSHFSVGHPRPFLPDIIEVGGMHMQPAKELPKDLKEFADSSGPEGFIYFSLGSSLKGSKMPEKSRKVFLNVFARLKRKVIWKWETEKMDDLPANVKLVKWAPQQDILGHPNCKVFLTHGGLGGMTEATYHGVPLVGMPFYGDQALNMKKAEKSGFALTVDYSTLSEESLFEPLNQILTEPRFRERVQHLSKTYRDQFGHPLDRAVFWTEYVLRHKGAPHLRSPARDLTFFQYHSLDVIFTLFGIVLLTVYIIFATFRFGLRKLCGSTKTSHQNGVAGLKKKTN